MLWGTVAWSFGQHATLWTNEAAYVELGYANINLQNKVASFPQTTTYIAPRLPRPTTWRNTRWNRSWRKFYVCRMVSRYTRIVISLHGCAKRNETYLTQSENQCNRLWQPWLQARMTSLCPKRGKLLAAKGWEVLCVLLLWSFLRCWPKNLWARALTTKVFRNMWFINPVTIQKKNWNGLRRSLIAWTMQNQVWAPVQKLNMCRRRLPRNLKFALWSLWMAVRRRAHAKMCCLLWTQAKAAKENRSECYPRFPLTGQISPS